MTLTTTDPTTTKPLTAADPTSTIRTTKRGGTYTPRYISQAQFDVIINSSTERGNGK